jgi:hypothetical protein
LNPRIVSDIVTILDESLPKNIYALDFTTKQYQTLLEKLMIINNEALFNDKKGAIRRALIQYFSKSYQSIEVDITLFSCTIKKHFIDPSKSEAFDRMLHLNGTVLIDIFKRKSEFSPLEYLISIPEEIRSPILQNYLDFNETIDMARQMTRQQIDKIFSLDERDIIFFLRGRISIRNYTPPKKIPNGIDKRFGGESVEKMDAMYLAYFSEGAWEYIEPILGEVIAEKLNFSEIDNATFTRTFIPVFRSMIEILLLEIVNEEERERIEGFTGYVLRQHFHSIFLYTAKNLLQFVENRDKNAENFIKHFTDDIIIDANGNKIQKYAITDTKQQKWNYSSIVSVMMQYKQAKVKIASQKEAILSAQERVTECQEEIALEKNAKQELLEKITGAEDALSENDIEVLKIKNKIAAKSENSSELKGEITKLNYRHTELLEVKKSLISQMEVCKNRISNKGSEFTRRQNKLKYEKKSLESIIEQMATVLENYELIAEATATVLTKR